MNAFTEAKSYALRCPIVYLILIETRMRRTSVGRTLLSDAFALVVDSAQAGKNFKLRFVLFTAFKDTKKCPLAIAGRVGNYKVSLLPT
jgi:hypothetical protein